MLLVGDLSAIPETEAVDLLVMSAFPDDYIPTHSSLIGSLSRRGVSVAELAADKEVDLRRFSSCWLSREISRPDLHFRRILCFEPRFRGRAGEVVGDIFRSIIPFTTSQPPITQIAIPLVASGDQGELPEAMLEALVDAAVHWLSVGLPLERIKIVLHKSVQSLGEAFARVKQRLSQPEPGQQESPYLFDIFVSYSQKNMEAVDTLVGCLRAERPSLRVFLDRMELRPGAAWQEHIFDALDASRKVICAFSPDYLTSKVCKEEFNIALFRHRESSEGVLLPVYMYTTILPTYMKLVQYTDVREGDPVKIALAAKAVIEQI
jgi:hypothetical protein